MTEARRHDVVTVAAIAAAAQATAMFSLYLLTYVFESPQCLNLLWENGQSRLISYIPTQTLTLLLNVVVIAIPLTLIRFQRPKDALLYFLVITSYVALLNLAHFTEAIGMSPTPRIDENDVPIAAARYPTQTIALDTWHQSGSTLDLTLTKAGYKVMCK